MAENFVIVIDPGHGGSNEGLNYDGFLEKDMNLVTAKAMQELLQQYDNTEVYITNPDKKDMSLKERAEYAKSVEADVMVSLHFNMSENHTMYGSEVWIPSTGLANAKMHALGDIILSQLSEHGLTIRGVKTRLNDSGTDYYGIIRESAALDLPCIPVEHIWPAPRTGRKWDVLMRRHLQSITDLSVPLLETTIRHMSKTDTEHRRQRFPMIRQSRRQRCLPGRGQKRMRSFIR